MKGRQQYEHRFGVQRGRVTVSALWAAETVREGQGSTRENGEQLRCLRMLASRARLEHVRPPSRDADRLIASAIVRSSPD